MVCRHFIDGWGINGSLVPSRTTYDDYGQCAVPRCNVGVENLRPIQSTSLVYGVFMADDEGDDVPCMCMSRRPSFGRGEEQVHYKAKGRVSLYCVFISNHL